jgi:hypothetical protein
MTESRQQVYVSDGFSEPMSAQHNFANNFDLNDPDRAMTEYQRYVAIDEHDSYQLLTTLGSCTSTPSASSPLPRTRHADEAALHRPTTLSALPAHSNHVECTLHNHLHFKRLRRFLY